MSGQSAEPKPRPASEVMLRRTWAYRWDQEEVPKLFDRLAELFLTTSQEAHWWGDTGGLGVVRGNLTATAEDLDALADFLDEDVAKAPGSYEVEPEDPDLCHRAAAWRDRFREIVAEIRVPSDN